ncbi:MAG: hypothetical protein R3A48_22285 [Polyangiales bacterium]
MAPTKLAVTIGICASLLAGEAWAVEPMSCFQRFAQPSSLAVGAARVTTMPVTLATTFHPSPGCVYGLAPDAARMVPLADAELDFAAVVEQLSRGASLDASPHTIFARTRAGAGAVESVFRESCTDVLFSDGLAFEARVDTSTRLLHVRRRALSDTTRRAANLSDCGASRVLLRFVALRDDAPPAFVARVPDEGAEDLALDRREIILGAPGRFAVYAARPSTPGDPRPAVLVGRLALDSPLTELRRAMSTAAREDQPWFRAGWSGDRMVFSRAQGTESDALWHEMVLAASSEQVWLADVPATSDDAHPRVHGALRVTAGRDGFVLPAGMVERAMRERYGRAGGAMSPNLREWETLRRGLQVCVAERYAHAPDAASPSRLPSDTRCARLASVTPAITLQSAQAAADAAPATPGQLCLQRNLWRLTARGMVPERALPPQCLTLGADPPSTLPLASVGDRASLAGAGQGHFLCIENHCRPVVAEEGGRGLRVWRAGLAELRRATSAEGALSRESLTLARFVAIDPLTDLHPVGLISGAPIPASETSPEDEAERADELRPGPWSTVPHDELDVFAYVRRRNALRLYLTTTPAGAGLWNTRERETVLTTQLPVAGGVQRSEGSPPGSGLVVLLTREATCPTEPSAGARARPAYDPDARVVDQTVHAFVARDLGAGEPFECVAHAAFRVREARAVAPTSWLHLGLLGDAQAAFFLADPVSFGVIYPVAYAQARLPVGFHLEGAVSATASVNFSDGELSRAGAGVSLALGWGPLGVAPRMISVGAMLHLATGSTDNNPWVSPYVALNLASILDALGGR